MYGKPNPQMRDHEKKVHELSSDFYAMQSSFENHISEAEITIESSLKQIKEVPLKQCVGLFSQSGSAFPETRVNNIIANDADQHQRSEGWDHFSSEKAKYGNMLFLWTH